MFIVLVVRCLAGGGLFPVLDVTISLVPGAGRYCGGGQAVDVMWLLLPMAMSRSMMFAAAAVLMLMMVVSIQCAFTVSEETENAMISPDMYLLLGLI